MTIETEKKYDIIIQCMGGGLSGQANAIEWLRKI
jgi:ribosomal protein S9